jgi:hypothetical protein
MYFPIIYQRCLRNPFRPHLFARAAVLALIACGSAESSAPGDPGPDPTAMGGSSSSGTGGGQSAAQGGGAAAPESTVPANQSSETGAGAAGAAGTSAMTEPSVGDACTALVDDACAACLCESCRTVLDTCAATSGCPEILACVRDSACSGNECFCGDALLPACLSGQGNGPCKQAVLDAPLGRQPTLADASGGPASDAALGVAECAEENDRCAQACGFAG